MGRLFPDINIIKNLHQKPTEGELALLYFLWHKKIFFGCSSWWNYSILWRGSNREQSWISEE